MSFLQWLRATIDPDQAGTALLLGSSQGRLKGTDFCGNCEGSSIPFAHLSGAVTPPCPSSEATQCEGT